MNNVSPLKKKRTDSIFVNTIAGTIVLALASPVVAIALGLSVRLFHAVAGS